MPPITIAEPATEQVSGRAALAPSPPRPASGAPLAWIRRHPLLSYYALTFGISWGTVLVAIGGPTGLSGTPDAFTRLMPVVIAAMLLGPSIAAVLLTGLVEGGRGYRRLLARLLRWRVGLAWYAVALLLGPAVFLLALSALSVISPAFLPGIVTATDRPTFILLGTAPGLLVGLLEELGWTGFVIPRVRLRHRVMATGLIVGLLWGAWHLLTNDLWAGDASASEVPAGVFVTLNGAMMVFGQLPAFRVLMVWVYDHTQSLLVAVLMHASLVFSTFVLAPAGLSGMPALYYPLAVGLVMWAVVAVLARRLHGHDQVA